LHACENLTGCFDGTLRFEDEERGKTYELADDKLSKPIKRIPGLALPDGNHLLDGEPLPLHLVDFALHLFHNWQHPEALVFYVPKLENEEEATYVKTLIAHAEQMIVERLADERLADEQLVDVRQADYEPGTIKLFIVFENPRAIFRIREIAAALSPHFIGGSLGWHDFLASTARVFRRDPRYRIPVKADPNIVINHIKESHEILAGALAPMGAISIGGMYGVLFEGGNRESFEVSMVGYIKDVTAQLKRGLDGFWVAHPDFVRPGIALVEAFRRWNEEPSDDVLERLIEQLVPDPVERAPLEEFVFGDDVKGLAEDDPLYLRGVLAASVETSDVIRNDDPEEVRYNVFQAVQYLADWLSGNGCVALPATMENARGEEVFVRIMDDLATTERSRWELWAEIAHGRVSVELFDQILVEELTFIREGRQTPTKRVQVAWEGEAARWYPVAARLLRQLVTAEEPPEFATELLLPFTLDCVREAEDAWEAVGAVCPGKFGVGL
jgi:malate synthase